jgi:SAM-dependent methyltransferase
MRPRGQGGDDLAAKAIDPPAGGHSDLEDTALLKNYNAFIADRICASAVRLDNVLDFGAGTGNLAVLVKSRASRLTCIEPDAGNRRVLATRGLATEPTLDAVADGSQDHIFTSNVLEHIEDDRGTLATLHRKLVPGGTLFVFVPAFPLLYSAMDRKVGHVRRYTRARLVSAVGDAGFAVERVAYVDALGFALALLYKYVGDSEGRLNRTALVLFDRLFPVTRLLDYAVLRAFGKNLMLVARK